MAEPTIDSATGGNINTIPPLAGEGSKTPPTPGKGLGTPPPIGGGPNVTPSGLPGAPAGAPPMGAMPKPKTPEEQADEALMDRSTETLVENISKTLSDIEATVSKDLNKFSKVTKSDVEGFIDKLIEAGFSPERLKEFSTKAGMEPVGLFKKLIEKIKSSGEAEAIDYLKEKITPEEEGAIAGTPSMSESLKEQNPIAPPPPGVEQTARANFKTDVHLIKQNQTKGEMTMNKDTKVVITNEGTLEEVPNETVNKKAEVLQDLVLAIRKTKSAISAFEDEKLKYAGTIAIKKAMGEDEEDMDADFGADTEDIEPMDDEMDEDMDKEKVLSGLDKIRDGIDEIEAACSGVEKEMEDEEEFSPEDTLQTEGLMGIAEATITKAREVIKTAKREITAVSGEPKDPARQNAKAKLEDKKVMDAAMGGSPAKKKAMEIEIEDDEKDEDKKEDKKDKKEKESSTDELIRRVKARLAELREEKEANLYPFKELQGPVEKVDNINERDAKQMNSTVNSEIKKQPVQDKDDPTINLEIAQKDLPYKTEGSKTGKNDKGQGVKLRTANDAQDVQDAIAQARLSVELASLQQLKGLINNPLKEAFVKNMREAGIPENIANDIAHNAFIDGYEDAQKVIIKEAFTTFMDKSIDDFIKVSKFTKDYDVKEGTVLASVEDEETRDKSASANAPLRGSTVTDKSEMFKDYWQDVKRNRRGF